MMQGLLKHGYLALGALLISGQAMAQAADRGALAGDEIWQPVLRMGLSLIVVLAVLAGCAWAAKRLRRGGAFQGGLIQITGGLSLGGRDKVVLLRVGGDELLVGVSPSGMRLLHVLNRKAEPKEFDDFLEQTQSLERRA